MKKFAVLMLVVLSVVLTAVSFVSAKAVDNHHVGTSPSRFDEFAKLFETRTVEYAEHRGVFDIPSFIYNEKIEYRAHEGVYSGTENFRNSDVTYTEHQGQYDIPAVFQTVNTNNTVSIESLLSGNETREDVYAALEANGNFFCRVDHNYLLCKAKDAGKKETINYFFSRDELQAVEYSVVK